MVQVEVPAKVGAKRCKDGQDHRGKRKLTLPESLDDITSGAWAKAAEAECKKAGIKFDAAAFLSAGYKLAHQRDMAEKLLAKFGSPVEKSGKVRDLSDAETL